MSYQLVEKYFRSFTPPANVQRRISKRAGRIHPKDTTKDTGKKARTAELSFGHETFDVMVPNGEVFDNYISGRNPTKVPFRIVVHKYPRKPLGTRPIPTQRKRNLFGAYYMG